MVWYDDCAQCHVVVFGVHYIDEVVVICVHVVLCCVSCALCTCIGDDGLCIRCGITHVRCVHCSPDIGDVY